MNIQATDNEKIPVINEQFKEYYCDVHMHESIAETNRSIKQQALDLARELKVVRLFVLSDSFGSQALMQIDAEGNQTRLVCGFRDFESEDVGERLILTTIKREADSDFSYDLVVGDDRGYRVEATDLDCISKNELVAKYRGYFNFLDGLKNGSMPCDYCQDTD